MTWQLTVSLELEVFLLAQRDLAPLYGRHTDEKVPLVMKKSSTLPALPVCIIRIIQPFTMRSV